MDYSSISDVYQDLEKTTKRLEKTGRIAGFLKNVPEHQLVDVVCLLQGKPFPQWDQRKIGFSTKLMLKAIARVTGEQQAAVENVYNRKGDLGIVVEDLLKKRKQSTLFQKRLTADKVLNNIRKLAELEGKGAVERKVSLVSELLSSSTPVEARFIVRTILEQLRVGIASGIIRDAIAQAFKKEPDEIEAAFHVKMDYGEVARMAKLNKLSDASMQVGKPVNCMLALLVRDIPEAFKALGSPALFEYKLDGFRLQIHKDSSGIKLFTRKLEDVTTQFPDVVKIAKECVKGLSFIIDTEAVGYSKSTGKYLPFQNISQRIKRKYNINDMARKFPVELNVFDILYYNSKSCLARTQKERRELIEKIILKRKGRIRLTKKLVTSSTKKAEAFYKESLRRGNEGLMVKNLEAYYKPGRYVDGWVKLKPVLEPLDLVITGAEYGTGKRAGMLTSYVISCTSGNEFLSCGMVSTGLKEREDSGGTTFRKISGLLQPLITSRKGSTVEISPRIVVEVAYEEIQQSPTYSSGYALRFPRFKSLRTLEKTPKDVNTLDDIKRIYRMQKKTNHY